jgi:hypothetical protein
MRHVVRRGTESKGDVPNHWEKEFLLDMVEFRGETYAEVNLNIVDDDV